MFYINTIFTPDAINVFTDASIKKLRSGETIGCAGSIAVFGEPKTRNEQERYQIIRNTTSNNSEIKAIRLGIEQILPYKNYYKKIRLFSDSQLSIFGIRDRILNWKFYNGKFIGSNGAPIINQDIFSEIVHTILENDLYIEFYHQKGHVGFTDKSLNNAMHVFTVSNNIRTYVDMLFIKQITVYNDMVDNNSRQKLENICRLHNRQYIEPLIFEPDIFDKSRYRELTRYNN